MNQCSPLHLPSSGEDLEQKIYLHQFLPAFEASSLFFSPLEEGSSEIDIRRRPITDQEVKEDMFFSGSDSLVSEATAEDNGQGEECKWMSSKMRFMKKMKFAETSISSENSSSSSPNGSIRVCSECNTTKTPLWRSGPCGPKSLCNACGIRQRKARRAMAAAVSGGLIPAIAPPIKKRKPKKSSVACSVPFKKRFKCFSSPENRKKFHCDEITISLSNSALPRVFPQDEKEAAILLMALSCGLLRR